MRFLREDGHYTPWVSAGSLWTNDRAVFLRHRAPPSSPGGDALEGVEWAKIQGAEVRNFEGGRTVLAIAGAGAIVGLFAAAVIADANDDSKCASTGRRCGASRTAAVAQIADAGTRLATAAAANDAGEGGPTAPTARFFSDPQAPRPDAEGARPVFDAAARRKDVVKVLVALESTATSDAGGFSRVQPGALAGARFGNFFEAGVGARMLAPPDEGPARTAFVARAGFHGEFGPRRRVALPLSVDVGAGEGVSSYVRLNAGLRVRLVDELTLGLHPASPTRIERERGRSGWSISSGAELSWGF